MKRIIYLLSFMTLFLNFKTYSRIIDKDSMAGWYDCVNDDKKYLSPFLGYIAVETDFCKKIYDFGQIKADKKTLPTGEVVVTRVFGGDPVVVLTYALFHKVGSNFKVTADKSYPAAYLTAADIGKILDRLEKVKSEHVSANEVERLQDDLGLVIERAVINGFERDHQEQYGCKYNKFYEDLESKFNLLRESFYGREKNKELKLAFEKYPRRAKKKLSEFFGHDINFLDWVILIKYSKEGLKNNVLNSVPVFERKALKKVMAIVMDTKESFFEYGSQLKDAIAKGRVLAKAIVDSLKVCGYLRLSGEKSLKFEYDKHSVHTIFLAFLYDLVEKTEQFDFYFSQFTPMVIKENYKEILKTKKFDQKETSEKLDKMFGFIEEGKKIFIKNNFEQIAYAQIEENSSGGPLFANHYFVVINSEKFTACAEASALNWICFLMYKIGLWDKETKLYETNPEKIKQAIEKNFNVELGENNIDKIAVFFANYDNKNVRSGVERLQKFTEIISNLPGIKYLRKFDTNNRKYEKNDDNSPFVHKENVDGKETTKDTYGKYSLLVDENDCLYELAGCPSSFIKLINYFFGFKFDNLLDLCETLKIKGDQAELNCFTDDNAYKSKSKIIKAPEVNLFAEILDKNVSIKLIATTGHSSIFYTSGPSKKIKSTLISDYVMILPNSNAFTNRNLIPLYVLLNEEDVRIYRLLSIAMNLDVLKSAAFSLNLYDGKVMCFFINSVLYSSELSDFVFHLLDLIKEKLGLEGVIFKKQVFSILFDAIKEKVGDKQEGLDLKKDRIFEYLESFYSVFDFKNQVDVFEKTFRFKQASVEKNRYAEKLFFNLIEKFKSSEFSKLELSNAEFNSLGFSIVNSGDQVFSVDEQITLLQEIRKILLSRAESDFKSADIGKIDSLISGLEKKQK